jgi:hypothetical protein
VKSLSDRKHGRIEKVVACHCPFFHPEGMSACSRWLRKATPPDFSAKSQSTLKEGVSKFVFVKQRFIKKNAGF